MRKLTNRDQKREIKGLEHKKLISLFNKHMRLLEAGRNIGYIELEIPIFRGYKRFYILRNDIKNRKDANIINKLLKLINTTVYSKNKSFLTKEWKTKKIVPITQDLNSIGKKVFEKLTPTEKKYFTEIYDFKSKCFKYYWINKYFFIYKIEKYFQTKAAILDPDLESQLSELENKITTHNLWHKIYKARGRSWSYKDYYDIKKRLIEKAIDLANKEQLIQK